MKNYFPIFHNQPQLVYLDNAATTQKPYPVIQALTDFYSKFNANVGRSSCNLEITLQNCMKKLVKK